MKNFFLASSLFFATSLAHARDVQVSVDDFFYSSPSSVLLPMSQETLAKEAAKTCGDAGKVLGINQMNIEVRPGINGPVGALASTEGRLAIDLNYPKIHTTAVVTCKD
jgi:hypothetical protein